MNTRTPGMVSRLHGVGATLSFACAVHCLAMPFLLGVLPVLGLQFFADERVEWGILVGAIAIALWNAVGGVRSHGRRVILLAFGGGAILMVGSHIVEGVIHGILMGTGGLVLFASQLINRRWCRRCCDSCIRGVAKSQLEEA